VFNLQQQGVPPKANKKTQASITLSDALGGVTVLQKGETDIISFSHSTTAGGERETAEVAYGSPSDSGRSF
jgi:hypothetical protein